MEALTAREHRIYEGTGQVEPAPRMVQHAFDEGAHVLVGEDEAGQLGDTGAGHEHARCRVDPDFLNRRVVHERLKGPQAADVVHEIRFDLLSGRGQQVGCVSVDGAVNEGAHGSRVSGRVDTARG